MKKRNSKQLSVCFLILYVEEVLEGAIFFLHSGTPFISWRFVCQGLSGEPLDKWNKIGKGGGPRRREEEHRENNERDEYFENIKRRTWEEALQKLPFSLTRGKFAKIAQMFSFSWKNKFGVIRYKRRKERASSQGSEIYPIIQNKYFV